MGRVVPKVPGCSPGTLDLAVGDSCLRIRSRVPVRTRAWERAVQSGVDQASGAVRC
jgi:hypothetical protein